MCCHFLWLKKHLVLPCFLSVWVSDALNEYNSRGLHPLAHSKGCAPSPCWALGTRPQTSAQQIQAYTYLQTKITHLLANTCKLHTNHRNCSLLSQHRSPWLRPWTDRINPGKNTGIDDGKTNDERLQLYILVLNL